MNVGKDDLDVCAGDQGTALRQAGDEMEDAMPLAFPSQEVDLRRPLVGSTIQVTIEYVQRVDGSVAARDVHTVVNFLLTR